MFLLIVAPAARILPLNGYVYPFVLKQGAKNADDSVIHQADVVVHAAERQFLGEQSDVDSPSWRARGFVTGSTD